MFLVQSAVTCAALFWLLHRAWLTLWKPVPELISILGVEVPEPPQVSLAGIKAESITLQWTRPETNKVVYQKYLIQVNGVNVGDTPRTETSITVTGLKPAHFYNVRVIAVGNNNFQAGSRVIRLRTYNSDGKPDLGGRVPSIIAAEDAASKAAGDTSVESACKKGQGVAIEAAAVPGGMPAPNRDAATGSRRNTAARKHSPSTASEHPPLPANAADFPEGSMQDLTERFESIRKETEDVIAQIVKDAEDNKTQVAELIRERDEKKQQLKEKEETSEKLKKEVHASERLNRQAQTRKTLKEKVLKEKQAERDKMVEDMRKWESEIEEMRAERELWEKEKAKIAADTAKKAQELKSDVKKRQNALTIMEEEIRVKGLQNKEMEEERKTLPGAEDDEETKALQAAEELKDQQWDLKEKELMHRYNSQSIVLRNLENDLHKAQMYFQQLSMRHMPTPMAVYHANPSNQEVDTASMVSQSRPKQRRNRQRKSRTNTLSNAAAYPLPDNNYACGSNVYGQLASHPSPNFAPGPYFDMSATAGAASPDHTGMSDSEIKSFTAGAPLSPTATSLLPSNIFNDDDPMERALASTQFPSFPNLRPTVPPGLESDPKYSPESSSRSASLLSSPQASQTHLAMLDRSRDSWHENDRFMPASRRSTSSFGAIGSPASSSNQEPEGSEPAKNRFGDLFSFANKQRSKTLGGDGLPLGALKPGQSNSFPRQDMDGAEGSKNRRTSFTTGWDRLPFLNRNPSSGLSATEGNGPALARNLPSRRRRGFNMFGNSIDDPNAILDRSPSSPRPASIASSDLPRPSTDSAPFGWAPSDSNVITRNSPLATNWSLNPLQPWSASRAQSRRPSLNMQSIVSDDDEFLPPDALTTSPSPAAVGVIGSRPISQMSNKLNPAAPTFKAMFARAKKDRSDAAEDKKDKGKGKEKEIDADESQAPDEYRPISERSNRSDTRASMSRDTHSIHTLASLTESYDSLEQAPSSNAMSFSEMQPSFTAVSSSLKSDGSKGETSFQKLLRKGSSSKFSIGSFGRERGWGGAKKEKDGKGKATPSLDGTPDEGGWEDEGVPAGSPVPAGTPFTSADKDGKPTSAGREGRMSVNWGRFGIKKKKEGEGSRKSGELERERGVFDLAGGMGMSPSTSGQALGSGVLLKGSKPAGSVTDDEDKW